MKLLLTGMNGQLGFELQQALSVLGDVIAINSADCDLADEVAIQRVVRAIRPDVIVNPAAYTSVDKAETESTLAQAINARAPAVLAEEAEVLGALLIHYSTDYVFDGTKGFAYVESDTPNPINVYGATKLTGEKAIKSICKRYLILRTSWVVGAHGSNFAKTMLGLAHDRDVLNVVADQFGAPTSASLLADLTAHLVRQALTKPDGFPYGLYHSAAAGETNWHAYACYVINRARKSNKHIRVAPEKIKAISTDDYPTPAKRPANSRLDTSLLRETFGLHLPDWKIGVDHVLDQIL